MFSVSSWRTEIDRRRAQIESEPVVVVEGIEVTLAGLRELLHRAEHQRLKGSDWAVLESLISEVIAEAGDREIVTITFDAEGPGRSGPIVDQQSTPDGERWASAAEASAPSRAERPSQSGEDSRG